MNALLGEKHRRETLVAMAEAILPARLGDGDVQHIVDELLTETTHAPLDRQQQLAKFMDLLDGGLFVRALGGSMKAFRFLTRGEREHVLRRLATHSLPQMRGGFQAIRKGLCFVAYARMVDSGDALNPLWPPMAYPGPRDDRPPRGNDPLPITPLDDLPGEVDVVVVGSGAGGGVAAAVFAQAGHRVLVLEEGDRQAPGDVDQQELESYRRLFLERGGASSEDLAIGILAGRTVGGGTVVNWNVSLRLEPEVGREWDERSRLRGLAASLQEHYDAVSRRLDLQPIADNANNARLRAGCETLGWDVHPIPRNASGCGAGCGYCTFGCAYGRKRDTPATWLRDAVESGALIAAGAQVERVIIEGDREPRRVTGVVVTGRDGRTHTIAARLVIAACGSLRTPKLLSRSGVRSPALGRNLYLHPASAMLGVYDARIDPWLGAPMSSVSKRFAQVSGQYGVVLESVPTHPGLASVAVPWFGSDEHARDLERLAHTASIAAITRDRNPGSVGVEDVPLVKYRVSRFDGHHMLRGLGAGARIHLAAGAREIYTTHTPALRLTREQASEAKLREFERKILRAGHAPNRIAVFSAHQMGTARMSARANEGVIDERGQVHGVRGLLVCDASTFPAASGVNPMLTIMAMARRIAMLHC